ncbi:MAG: GGDEF domain-containing response regulator [Myxococcota bacterium]
MADRWTVLLVDDALSTTAELQAALSAAGAKLRTATTAADAIALLVEEPVDLALVDVELPGESGTAVLQHLRADGGQVPVILFSLRDDPAARAEAFARGADDYLLKPIDVPEVVARVLRRLSLHRALIDARAENARLHGLAVTDGLTQVANHRYFQERLREEFRRAQRYDDPLALILLDLDHFKAINDNFGHQLGDEVLRGVAAAMKSAVRETDFLARYGGEEFSVLLPKTHLAGALTVAERVSHELKKLVVGPPGLKVTASFGVSGFPGRSVSTPEQLVATADQALYRAKREGRNKISLFQASLLAS